MTLKCEDCLCKTQQAIVSVYDMCASSYLRPFMGNVSCQTKDFDLFLLILI